MALPVTERKALKYDNTTTKLPWDLLPFDAVEGMLRVLLFGKRKYTTCSDCTDEEGRATKVYPNPKLNGDPPRDDCPKCGSKNITDGAHNWRLGFNWSRLVASSYRHLKEAAFGELRDPDSEELHVHHLMCCVAFFAEHITKKLGINDLFRY